MIQDLHSFINASLNDEACARVATELETRIPNLNWTKNGIKDLGNLRFFDRQDVECIPKYHGKKVPYPELFLYTLLSYSAAFD